MDDFGQQPLGGCQSCGQLAPTQHVVFHKHIGALVVMFHNHVEGSFCRKCIDHYFWSFTGLTFFLGWWGFISFFITPVVLIVNGARYLGASGLPSADARHNY